MQTRAQPPSLPRAVFAPDHRQLAPKNKKGRAGRRGFADPHGLVSKGKDTRVVFRRFRLLAERPARDVLGLLRTNPGGLTWPSLFRTGRSLSTAGRSPTPDAPYSGYERPRPGDPNCGARQARRAPCSLGRRNARASHAAAIAAPLRLTKRLPEGAP